MILDALGGNKDNESIARLTKSLFGHNEGKMIYSNRNAESKSSVIISDDGVTITNPNTSAGIVANSGSVTIQGTTYMSSKHSNIRKGEYSDNDRTRKIFTYRETVLFESMPKEVASQAAGQAGVNLAVDMPLTNTSVGMDGLMNIITDVAASPIPHVHSISMKHVHRVEPGHLYRIPSVIGFVKSCLTQLTSFLNA